MQTDVYLYDYVTSSFGIMRYRADSDVGRPLAMSVADTDHPVRRDLRRPSWQRGCRAERAPLCFCCQALRRVFFDACFGGVVRPAGVAARSVGLGPGVACPKSRRSGCEPVGARLSRATRTVKDPRWPVRQIGELPGLVPGDGLLALTLGVSLLDLGDFIWVVAHPPQASRMVSFWRRSRSVA
jgi:hypothetical protein